MSSPSFPMLFAALPAALLAAGLSGCSPNEPVASEPGTTPPVWTGSAPTPALSEARGGAAEPAAAEPADTLTVQINAADGSQIAAATIEFTGGVATVTVQTTAPGRLSPGIHGMHIHAVGKCEANSVAPTGGAPGDFLSAGGHFQGGGAPGHPGHAGDLSPLQVRPDGSALLVTTTSAFTREDLTGGAGTAIIIHEGADNFANIPPDRYQQINGAPPPDEITLATGDAGKRVGCGVIG